MATTTRPAPRPTAKRKAPAQTRSTTARRPAALPDWSDLTPTPEAKAFAQKAAVARAATKKATTRARRVRPLDAAPSLRFGTLVLAGCLVVTLFVAHVYATRATLAELQEARKENVQLRLTHQRLRGEYDRMTGPDAVMDRAAALGLEEGVAYGPTIHLQN